MMPVFFDSSESKPMSNRLTSKVDSVADSLQMRGLSWIVSPRSFHPSRPLLVLAMIRIHSDNAL